MGSIFKSSSGAFVAQVNIGGKRRSKSFETKVLAQRWIRQEEAATDAGKRRGDPDMRFGQLVETYVAVLGEDGVDVPAGRISAYRIIGEIIGRTPVSEMDVALFRRFVKERRAMGAGPSTIGQDLTYIGTIMRTAGPVEGVPVAAALEALTAARKAMTASGAISRSQERTRRPTDRELITLRDFWAKRRRGIPMWTLTTFAIATAMRLSEITGLRWSDLDEDKRTIVIRDRKHPRSKKGNDQTVPLLKGHALIDGAVVDPMEIIRSMPREGALIFPFDPSTVSTMFTRACTSTKIEDLQFHDLRHDGVSRMFKPGGYSIEQVALVSGHRDWNQLRRYTQIKAEDLHRDKDA